MARKFVLAVDGGGIRCIISALILVDLERRMRESGRVRPFSQYFHLMAGSGIGALLCAALAYARAGGSDDIGPALANMVEVFHSAELMFAIRIRSGSGQIIYDTTNFEQFLRHRFGETRLVADAATHVLFPAFNLARRAPAVFSDLDPATAPFYLWQALRATTAAPQYMPPALVEDRASQRPRGTPLIPFVAIGRYSDDPSLAAYVQAQKLGWQEGEGFTLLSIGSGVDASPIPYFNPQGNHGLNMTDVTTPLIATADELYNPIANHVNLLMNTDPRAFTGVRTKMTAENRGRLSYFRINGAIEKAAIAENDYSVENIRLLQDEAARIIVENAPVLDEIVRRLPEPESVAIDAAAMARAVPVMAAQPQGQQARSSARVTENSGRTPPVEPVSDLSVV